MILLRFTIIRNPRLFTSLVHSERYNRITCYCTSLPPTKNTFSDITVAWHHRIQAGISHGGDIYTVEIGKPHRSRLPRPQPPRELVVKHWPAHLPLVDTLRYIDRGFLCARLWVLYPFCHPVRLDHDYQPHLHMRKQPKNLKKKKKITWWRSHGWWAAGLRFEKEGFQALELGLLTSMASCPCKIIAATSVCGTLTRLCTWTD